jgi:hypothetical protein
MISIFCFVLMIDRDEKTACVKRCGPSRRRLRSASAALKNFVRQPKKTFATLSAQSGHLPSHHVG